MKPSLLIKVYAFILMIIFGGIVLHAPFSVSMGVVFPQAELLIKSWKELLLVIASIFGLIALYREGIWRELAKDKLLQVVGLYIALHMLLASAVITGPIATLAGLAIDLRYVLFFVLVYILLQIAPEYRKRFLQIIAAGAVVVIGFAVLQLFLPADILSHIGYSEHTIQPYLTVDKNPDFIRVNSTLRGPNPLGAYIVIALALLAAAAVRGKARLRTRKDMAMFAGAVAASLIALWITYSRSALIGAGLAVGVVIIVASRHLLSRRVWIVGTVLLFALIGGVFAGRDHPFITNVLLHENREGGSDVSSNDGHVDSVIVASEKMLHRPFGGGIGSTGSASLMTDSPLIIENQYLFIAHEVGWLGLVLFMVLFSLILVRSWQNRRDWLSLGVFASGIGLAVIGLIQPVWVDDTVAIIWWGLAAIAVSTGGAYVRHSAK